MRPDRQACQRWFFSSALLRVCVCQRVSIQNKNALVEKKTIIFCWFYFSASYGANFDGFLVARPKNQHIFYKIVFSVLSTSLAGVFLAPQNKKKTIFRLTINNCLPRRIFLYVRFN